MIKQLFFTLCLLVVMCGSAWGATLYSCPAGQTVGTCGTADAGTCCTLTRAIAASSNNDTIIVGDGTYTGGANSETNYWTVAKPLTFTGASDYGATFVPAASQTRIFHVPAAGAGSTIGKITLDGNNTATAANRPAYCVSFDSAAGINGFTINGTHLINYKNAALGSSAYLYNVTMTGGWLIQSDNVAATDPISITSNAAGAVSIQNGTIIQSNFAGILRAGINVQPTAATSLLVKNVSMTLTSATASLKLFGVYAAGATSYDIGNNQFTITNDGTSVIGAVRIINSATASTSCSIYNNSGTLNSTGGYQIAVGDDDDTGANANKISAIKIYGNDFTGANHGYFVSWQTTPEIYKNISRNPIIGTIFKHSVNAKSYNNIVVGGAANLTGGGLRDKASAGSSYLNNTVVMSGAADVCLSTSQSDDTLTQTTAVSFINNICYGKSTATVSKYSSIGNTTTVTSINNNDYYSLGTLNTNPWTYRASNYTTMALWQAAGYDANGLTVDPKFKSSTNFHAKNTLLKVAGVDVGLLSDFDGKLYGGKFPIGAFIPSLSGSGSSFQDLINYIRFDLF